MFTIGTAGEEGGVDVGWISLELPLLKKMQAMMKRVSAKRAVRIVQQTSVDHLLLSYTGN